MLNHTAMTQTAIDNCQLLQLQVDTLINTLLPHPLIYIIFFFPDFFKNGPARSVTHEIILVWPKHKINYLFLEVGAWVWHARLSMLDHIDL